ncbi:MAG: insulinase family protein [Brevundimonas sp.]|nr:insulinase family protein [Brevundimonas sp.]
MTRTAALLGASLLALASPSFAQDAASISVPPLEYTHRELANGLDVYAMPDPTAGTVTVTLWYDVGGKDDPEGRSGFAHLFEHILSRKTVNLPYGQISTMVENAGGSRNASTGQDFTNYYETVPPQYLETMLWTHAERMARPVVDQAVFDAERSIVKEELRQRVLAPPYGRFQRFVIGDNSYDESIYRRSVIGSIEELDSAQIEDARAFHEAYYRPATATMIVSGNFDPAELDRLVDQYFADIRNPDRPVPVFERPVETPRTAPRMVDAYAPNVPLPAVGVIYPGVAANHPDAAALEVMSAILSRGESSRLHQALVYRTQLAASAGLGIGSNEEDGTITATAIVAQGKALADVEAALDAELARMRDEPVTAAELAEAKTEIVASELRQRETASGRAFILGQAIVSENNPKAPDETLAAIQAVTVADVQRVARTWLNDQARVSVRYQDESARPEGVPEDSWRKPCSGPDLRDRAAGRAAPERTAAGRPAHGTAGAGRGPGHGRAHGGRTHPAERAADHRGEIDQPADHERPAGARRRGGGGSGGPAGAGDHDGRARHPGRGRALGARDRPDPGGAGGQYRRRRGRRRHPDVRVRPGRFGRRGGRGAGGRRAAARLRRGRGGPQPHPGGQRTAGQFQPTGALGGDGAEPAGLWRGALWRAELGHAGVGGRDHPGRDRRFPSALVAAGQRDGDRHWRHGAGGGLRLGGNGCWADGRGRRRRSRRPAHAPERRRARAWWWVDMPGAGQAAVTAAVRAPRRADEAYYPLAVANAVMGSGQNGRLFQEVRAKRGLSYGAYSTLGARSEGGALVASTQTKNESAAEVVGLVLAEFDRLAAEPVADAEVTNRETFITGGFLRSLETTGGLGGQLAAAVIDGLPLSEIETYPGKIAATTPESLREAAGIVSAEDAIVVVVGQADLFIEALRTAHPDVVVIPAAELDLNSPTLGL